MTARYLIVELADIGDLILATPALAALREAQPHAHIALLTTTHSAPILSDGLVDEVIMFDRRAFNNSLALFSPVNLRRIWALRRGKYDTIVFFHHFTFWLGTLKFALMAWCAGSQRRVGLDNGKGWFLNQSLPDGGFGAKHQAQFWLDLVAMLGADNAPRPAVVHTQPYPLEIPAQKRVILHAGSGGYSRARRWEPEQFAVVADRLQRERGAQVILVGTPEDDGPAVKAAMQTEPLDLTGKTNLATLAGLIQDSAVYIGADSGVMHMASAVGTPIVAIFGPSNHAAWGPWTPAGRAAVIRSEAECSPCSYVEHAIGLRDGCPARTCMQMVTAAEVYRAACALLDNLPYTAPTPPNHTPTGYQRIHILGLPVDGITYEAWLSLIGEWVRGDVTRHVCTINPEFMMIARSDVNFRNILNRADLCVPDGVGLLLAARWQGQRLPERVTGSDGVPKIAQRAAQEGWKLFFLGAAPGIADQAAEVLRAKYPTLQIAGVYSGSPAPEEEAALVERINQSGADILFVAYGAPNQDKWIARNLPRLQVKMAMGVGGAFDFIAGVIARAPLWMQRMGLEWLYRLYLQPSRIGRMMRLPRFALLVLLRR